MLNNLPSTVIGLLHVELHIPMCDSLKEKRSILKRAINHVRKSWNVAISEVGDQDIWRTAILSIITVSGDRTFVENVLRKIQRYLDGPSGMQIRDSVVEIL
ncbi:DUF503 domain-containing protein [bacterium]|nr:DUF503 domain-containing protein [bacterium]